MKKESIRPSTNKGKPRKKKPRSPKESALELSLLERRAQAVALRRDGHSFDEIGLLLHVSAQTAAQYVQTHLLELREKAELDTEAIRDIELQRCDALLRAAWPKAKKGDTYSIQACLKVMERRSKLLGLDAPAKQDINLSMTTPDQAAKMTDAQINQRVKELMDRSALSQTDVVDATIINEVPLLESR